jgi:hypothetical protein
MAATDRFKKASEAARAAQRSGYVQRLIEDEALRANLLAAYGSARSAYGRMNNGKPAARALIEDRKLQREISDAIGSLREASSSLREEPAKRRRRGGLGRSLLVLMFAGVLAIALSESLRSKVLDTLFGAEEEFEYNSTTAPATPAPAPVAGS